MLEGMKRSIFQLESWCKKTVDWKLEQRNATVILQKIAMNLSSKQICLHFLAFVVIIYPCQGVEINKKFWVLFIFNKQKTVDCNLERRKEASSFKKYKLELW